MTNPLKKSPSATERDLQEMIDEIDTRVNRILAKLSLLDAIEYSQSDKEAWMVQQEQSRLNEPGGPL